MKLTDPETCSWCVAEVEFAELESNEQPDGALICDRCAAELS